jgi:cytochrome bd-type quinol oxidase subunit 2
MIQRIQSVYLFLAAVCSGLLYYFPVWIPANSTNATGDLLGPVGADLSDAHPMLLPFPLMLILLELICIFFYKKRKRQIGWILIASCIQFLFLVAATILISMETNLISSSKISEFRLGFALPVVAIILNYLALRNIRKDEALIKSMDRLR